MKKIFQFSLSMLAFVSMPLVAQITIGQSAMPVSGDTIRYSTANIVGADLLLKTKGANKTWDYSGLKPNGQDMYKYLASSKTPYAFYFINQIGLKAADSIGASTFTFKNLYNFYTKNSTVFKAEGLGYSFSGIPLAAKNTDDDEIYQFPLDYNDSDISTFRFVLSIPGQTLFTYIQAGKRTNVVDGWGSITTPYKTYSSVLRVKTYLDEIDSLVTTFAKIPIPRKQVIYKFLSTTEHIPVLEITGTETLGVFTATQIRYRDKYNGMQSPFRPRANFTVNKTSGVVNKDTFKLTSRSVLATNYQWQVTPSNGSVKFVSSTGPNTQNPIMVFTKAGLYTVSLLATNTFGTDDTTVADLIAITDPNSSTKSISEGSIQVYPNPVGESISISGLNVDATISIVDLSGKNILDIKAHSNSAIDVSHLKAGLYFLNYMDGLKSGTVKFIKQ